MPKRVKLNGDLADALKERGRISVEALQPSKPTETASTNGNGNGNSLVTVKSEQPENPEPDWSVEMLGEFARVEVKHIRFINKQMAVHVWRLGKALALAKAKVEKGEWKGSTNWCDFLKRYKVSVSSDWRARELYVRCPVEKTAKRLGITEAYRKFGLLKKPEGESPEKPTAPKPGERQKKEDDVPPPPKEDPNTLTMFLAVVLQRLEFYRDEAAFVDQDKKESPEHVGDLIDQVVAMLQKMKEMLPKPHQKNGKAGSHHRNTGGSHEPG
jgi:hypothetical protein